ncbi:MAG TPA: sigma-70 family RNA polymerase sigma factor, partial [Methylomirabilota bacterium]|nr:sigma-70 family RNA polymerase sigma factor [Methylomirabilota bacterium]
MDSGIEYQGLVLGHLDSLYNYALVLTRRSEDAEDLLQEVLVRGFQGFASFDQTLSFKGWMFTIIKNAYIDRFRRQRRLPPEEPLWASGEEPVLSLDNPLCSVPLAPEDLLLRREAIEQVREAIRRLPEEMREVVELRDVEGLSYREIAHVVNRPIGTVMSRLYRGRNLLRTCLVELRRSVEQSPPRPADQASKAKAHDR